MEYLKTSEISFVEGIGVPTYLPGQIIKVGSINELLTITDIQSGTYTIIEYDGVSQKPYTFYVKRVEGQEYFTLFDVNGYYYKDSESKWNYIQYASIIDIDNINTEIDEIKTKITEINISSCLDEFERAELLTYVDLDKKFETPLSELAKNLADKIVIDYTDAYWKGKSTNRKFKFNTIINDFNDYYFGNVSISNALKLNSVVDVYSREPLILNIPLKNSIATPLLPYVKKIILCNDNLTEENDTNVIQGYSRHSLLVHKEKFESKRLSGVYTAYAREVGVPKNPIGLTYSLLDENNVFGVSGLEIRSSIYTSNVRNYTYIEDIFFGVPCSLLQFARINSDYELQLQFIPCGDSWVKSIFTDETNYINEDIVFVNYENPLCIFVNKKEIIEETKDLTEVEDYYLQLQDNNIIITEDGNTIKIG